MVEGGRQIHWIDGSFITRKLSARASSRIRSGGRTPTERTIMNQAAGGRPRGGGAKSRPRTPVTSVFALIIVQQPYAYSMVRAEQGKRE
ncbi:hypothetical protein JMJ77_0003741 [Colletotrichum scovillei]|uniref:Uncharacterized protein n=1 Tax=Colletotrichum scovillei TaxID=1209932 RepID=A0A9P7QQ28_9PEZI|nr:hypothetical protein JMJ78_0008237 [Colletotrichum scovillei]KAG7040502.1 hypothetical protein JMJ77_0003741 [Colletotrichum scovillei]KAG7060550.1 hypothetical protein JMJ76_0009351 [Colletotrichum scovillei]